MTEPIDLPPGALPPGALPPGAPPPGAPRRGAQFARSLATSLFTTVLDFGTLIGLTELAGVNYVVSTWIGTVIGSLSNFVINKRWAFSARSAALAPALGRFALVQGGASGLHTVGVWALTRFGGVPYPVSKLVVAAAVYLGWNYPLNHWFVFRRPSPGPVRVPARP